MIKVVGEMNSSIKMMQDDACSFAIAVKESFEECIEILIFVPDLNGDIPK